MAFYVDDLLVATHKVHIPGPYAYMDGLAALENETGPASSTTMSVDSIFIGNNDLLQIASVLINLPVIVANSPTLPVYTSTSDF